MKKLLTVLMVLLMVFSLAACGKKDEGGEEGYNGPKIGVILVGDENEGYTYAHILGIREAAKALNIPDEAIIWKYNVPEDQTTYDMATDLVENGATLVLSNSYSHQTFMQQAASENPEVTFVALTGDNAEPSGLSNLKNAFPHTYESRYVSGVVAGLKLKELDENGELVEANFNEEGKVKIGYVGAFPYAEVVSGYTAFYLGIRSVYPDVTMYVEYTNSWFDLTAEATVGDDLMSKGCVIVGQHADSTGAPSRLQGNMENNTYGFTAYSVGYNVSMLDVAPDVALTSASNGWDRYYLYAFGQWQKGEEIMTNWSEGYTTGAVGITELGKACAPGTKEAVEEVVAAISSGSLHVFDISTFTVNGEVATDANSVDSYFNTTEKAIYDGYFHESELRSAPYFAARIDGIVELGSE